MFGIHSIEYDGLTSFFYLFAALENGSDWLTWDHVTELANEIGVPTVPVCCHQKQVNGHLLYMYRYLLWMQCSPRALFSIAASYNCLMWTQTPPKPCPPTVP